MTNHIITTQSAPKIATIHLVVPASIPNILTRQPEAWHETMAKVCQDAP